MPTFPFLFIRAILESFVHRGKANARNITRARILLKSADGWSTAELAGAFDVCEATVTNVRGRFAQGEVEAVLHDKVQQHRRNALSRRLPDEAALCRQVSAVETERNEQRRGIAWQFTSHDARRKLARLYPIKVTPSDAGGEGTSVDLL